jgi:hypothetical protein
MYNEWNTSKIMFEWRDMLRITYSYKRKANFVSVSIYTSSGMAILTIWYAPEESSALGPVPTQPPLTAIKL